LSPSGLTHRWQVGVACVAAAALSIGLIVGTGLWQPSAPPASALGCSGFSSGAGTSGDPYVIATRADLESLRACSSTINVYFKQTTSINLATGGNWTPISSFSGTYDGQGCSITNMTVAGVNGGLFGSLRGGSVVQNLKLTSVSVTSPGSTGALAATTASNPTSGATAGATLNGVVVSGSVSGANSYVGGVIGDASYNNFSATHVSFTGSVAGTKDYVGGLFGYPYGQGTVVTESYASGTVSGTRTVGGLFGYFRGSVDNSYAQVATTGTATSMQSTGKAEDATASLIAAAVDATITNSYATGVATGAGVIGTGSVTLASTTPTLTFDFAQSPLIGLGITGSGGTGSIGTGAVLVSQSSGVYRFTATGASNGTGISVSASGVNSGFLGQRQTTTFSGKNFFNVDNNPTPATGILTDNNTSTPGTANANLTGKSTADMQLAATYTGAGWSSSTWTLANGSYPTLTWFATGMPTCPEGGASGSASATTTPTASASASATATPSASASASATATPTPTLTPTITPTPSTSKTVTPSPGPTANLDPILNPVNPFIPVSGVPEGRTVYLLDGKPLPVTVAPDATPSGTALAVTGTDFFMKLAGIGDDSDPLGLTPKSALILQSRQAAARSAALGEKVNGVAKCVLRQPLAISSGAGFKPNSQVKMYILPATYIGALTVDGSGAYQGSLPIPVGILTGSQTLQANGFTASGVVRSLSLGILVKPGRTLVTNSGRTTVFFDPMSPVISKQGKSKLNRLVKRATRFGLKTVAIGFVQQTLTTSNDLSLSTQRARNVAAYLRSRGLGGAFDVRGEGVAGPGANARRVTVTMTSQSGC